MIYVSPVNRKDGMKDWFDSGLTLPGFGRMQNVTSTKLSTLDDSFNGLEDPNSDHRFSFDISKICSVLAPAHRLPMLSLAFSVAVRGPISARTAPYRLIVALSNKSLCKSWKTFIRAYTLKHDACTG